MLLTPHILAGVAIFSNISNPALTLFLVFLSHYFLDLFPQTEYSIKNIKESLWGKAVPDFLKVFSDIALALFIVFFLIDYNHFILAAIFLAILPDGISFLSCVFPKNKLLKAHQKIHNTINDICENKKIPAFWGIFSQVIVMTLAIFFLL